MTDVLIVGGSVAGLQAAITLARARRRVVVVDDRNPRNRTARHVHNFLGQPDPAPSDLLATARRQATGYGVTFVNDRVQAVAIGPGGVESDWPARALLLATGLRDELPDVPGLADLWGDRVVACPHCHGWEVRDQPLAQLGHRGDPARAVARALLLSRWSADVLLCTNGDDLTADDQGRLAKAGVAVDTGPVQRVESAGSGLLIVPRHGEPIPRRAVFVAVRQHQQSDLAARLGCDLRPDGAVAVDGSGRTSVPRVWAAGTTAVPALLAVGAAGHASSVAVALHAALLEEDLA